MLDSDSDGVLVIVTRTIPMSVMIATKVFEIRIMFDIVNNLDTFVGGEHGLMVKAIMMMIKMIVTRVLVVMMILMVVTF